MWFIGVEVEQETSAPPPKKNPGSAPEPKKETTAHPWSTSDSVKRPGSWWDSEEENYSPPIYKRISKEAWFGT